MRRSALLPLALVLLALPAAAQPSARAVVERATSQYRDQMKGVRDYTVTQEVMGTTQTLYFEQKADGGPLEYDAFAVGPDGTLHGEADDVAARTGAMLAELAERGRMVGEADVDGAATYAVAVDDFSAFAEDVGALEHAGKDAEVQRATFYFDQADYRMRRMVMEGEMTREDRRAPFTATMTFSDFRTVDGLVHPFRTTMEVQGLHEAMSAEERAQLEEARRQMANLPPEQRAMMERMMGGQLAQLEGMMGGDAFTVEMAVTDLKVNTGRPD